jgi:hypothetical protein
MNTYQFLYFFIEQEEDYNYDDMDDNDVIDDSYLEVYDDYQENGSDKHDIDDKSNNENIEKHDASRR